MAHISGFLTMYRTHCQRIFDFVAYNNVNEVHYIVLYFWKGLPTHITKIIDSEIICSMICVYDSILYRSICNLFFESIVKCLKSSLLPVAQLFVSKFESWLKAALHTVPNNLRSVKLTLCRQFLRLVERQTMLNELYRAAKLALHDVKCLSQMLSDWREVDFNVIRNESLTVADICESPKRSSLLVQSIAHQFKKFETLLETEVGIVALIDWLDSVVESCVLHHSRRFGAGLLETVQHFIILWTCFDSRIIRDMTLTRAQTFGPFHLLTVICSDYLQLRLEMILMEDEAEKALNSSLQELQGKNNTKDTSVAVSCRDKEFSSSIPTKESHDLRPSEAASATPVITCHHFDSHPQSDAAFDHSQPVNIHGSYQNNDDEYNINTNAFQTISPSSGYLSGPPIVNLNSEPGRYEKTLQEDNTSKYYPDYSYFSDAARGKEIFESIIDENIYDSADTTDDIFTHDWSPGVFCNGYSVVDVQYGQN